MKVLVTGGLGFIGSHVVEELLASQYEVEVVDNLSSGNYETNQIVHSDVEYHIKNFDNSSILNMIKQKRYEAVLHLAANASVPYSVEQPTKTHKNNLTSTLNLIKVCASSDTKFVFSSTSAVYGDNSTLPLTENSLFNPLSPYAVQKAAVELYCNSYSKTDNLAYACLRYFNVYGPRQNPEGSYPNVICGWIRAILDKKPIKIFGDGNQTRDFVYVKDVAKINVESIQHLKTNSNFVANVGSGTSHSLNDLLVQFNEYFGIIPVDLQPKRLGDVKHTLASTELLKTMFDYRPTALRAGLSDTIKWYKENNK